MQMQMLPEPVKRLLFLATAVIGVLILIGVGISTLVSALNPPKTGPASPTKPLQVSPLLFGTNLDFSLHDPQLQARQITPTQQSLQHLHVQIVRISLPDHPTTQQITQEAQVIQQIGAVPLLSLHPTWYPGALTDDSLAIVAISHVFPQQTVYYEYGDEEDAIGMTADQYAQSWNQMIPHLISLSSHAQFVGPATYHYDPQYFQRFLQLAHPLPNAISWHEFPCAATWSQQECLAGIDSWTQHISSARTWMSQHLHTTLPVMITAWNYAANPLPTDGKSTSQAFMSSWTQKALQTLAVNQVFASMQYSGINTPAPLISQSNTLTSQGQTFLSFYNHFITSSSSQIPPTSTSTPFPTSTPSPTPSPSPTPALTPTATSAPVAATTPIVSSTPTQGVTVIPSPTPSPTPTLAPPTPTPSPTPVPPTPTPSPTPVPPKPTPTPKPVCPPTVQSGSTGTWVKTLQQDLNSRGITDQNGKALAVDGDFGPLTLYAVKTWQRKAGTTVDGVVGPLTWHTLGRC